VRRASYAAAASGRISNQRLYLLNSGSGKVTLLNREVDLPNVGIANQVDYARGLMYHARMVGTKGDMAVGICDNSCCEGTGYAAAGFRLPEYLYSVDAEGANRGNLVSRPSTFRWTHAGATMAVGPRRLRSLTAPMSRCKLSLGSTAVCKDSPCARLLGSQRNGRPRQRRARGFRRAGQLHRARPHLAQRRHDSVLFAEGVPAHSDMRDSTELKAMKRYALEYGPILMAIEGSDDARLRARWCRCRGVADAVNAHLMAARLHFDIAGNPDFPTYAPYFAIKNDPFTTYPVIDRS